MANDNTPPKGLVWNAVDIALAGLLLAFLALVSLPALLMRPLIQARMLTSGCVIFLGKKKRTVKSIRYGDGLIRGEKSARVLKIEFEDGTETECHPQTQFKVTRAAYKRWVRQARVT